MIRNIKLLTISISAAKVIKIRQQKKQKLLITWQNIVFNELLSNKIPINALLSV